MTSFRIGPLASTPTPQQQQLLKEQRPRGHQLLAHIAKPWLSNISTTASFSNAATSVASGYVATTNRMKILLMWKRQSEIYKDTWESGWHLLNWKGNGMRGSKFMQRYQ
ncbi:predicted protein [Histoplasma capsulatum H143]|uniref:Uncharacterized protein n=1 Tax=Ajellomyces capsulatus (strain H143) TaxID=544712 RepID=C6HSG0_AJECH|nr:predicted protein [Histoplasma capsulatum H143]